MAALVRHDASAAKRQFVAADFEPYAGVSEVARLYDALDRVDQRCNPRTARLLTAGRAKMAQKVLEEAGEVALEAVRRRPRAVINESADLIYHLVVLWRACGIAPEAIWTEMRRRADAFGIAEKLPKSAAHGTAVARHLASGSAK
jgi:phosphoribosyl-ATP pyrophosphohydrolase